MSCGSRSDRIAGEILYCEGGTDHEGRHHAIHASTGRRVEWRSTEPPRPLPEHVVRVDSGKYTFVRPASGGGFTRILRHGEPWHEQDAANNALFSIMCELDAARLVVAEARRIVDRHVVDPALVLSRVIAQHDQLVDDREPPSAWCGDSPASRAPRRDGCDGDHPPPECGDPRCWRGRGEESPEIRALSAAAVAHEVSQADNIDTITGPDVPEARRIGVMRALVRGAFIDGASWRERNEPEWPKRAGLEEAINTWAKAASAAERAGQVAFACRMAAAQGLTSASPGELAECTRRLDNAELFLTYAHRDEETAISNLFSACRAVRVSIPLDEGIRLTSTTKTPPPTLPVSIPEMESIPNPPAWWESRPCVWNPVIEDTERMKVTGGWIYRVGRVGNGHVAAVFVPVFDSEARE